MAQSPYLVQALQSLGQVPEASQAPGMDPQALAGVLKQRKAYEAANPGSSYLGHNLMQTGRNLMAAPGNVMTNLRGLPGLFGLAPR